MLLAKTILRTKLSPPRPRRHTLARPRLDARLREALDYRVTIVQASTGYGKSTALAQLADSGIPLFWYSAGEGDMDPQQFLAHLVAAFQIGLPALANTPLTFLADAYAGAGGSTLDKLEAGAATLINALDQALGAPALLVIDDYHLAASPDVDALLNYFLAYVPRDLHVVVSTRYAPAWENLVAWRALGQVLEIRRDVLAFRPEEIAALFAGQYHLALSPQEAALLEEKTEGWPIVLQLIWQGLREQKRRDVAALIAP